MDRPIDGKDPVSEIKQIVLEKGVGKVILGLPLNLKGEEASSAEKAKAFAREINKETGLEVDLVDERLTSVAAENLLAEQGLNAERQRDIKDNIAAQVMLQRYLDTRNKTN